MNAFFQNLKGPFDDLLKWPIPWKSLTFTLFINDKQVGKEIGRSINSKGKFKEHFKRPTGDIEGQCLGFYKTFEHRLVNHVTANDKVAIKCDMDFAEGNRDNKIAKSKSKNEEIVIHKNVRISYSIFHIPSN